MNKFAASLGLVALGTTALHAVESTALNSMQSSKPWSVAASLRGFYDDNINTTPTKQGSAGFDISPSVNYGLAGDQSSFNLGYQLTAKYYDNRPAGQSDNWDFTHQFNGAFAHTFSPRVNMNVNDSFVIGQEPDMLRAGNLPFSTVQVVPGNNIVNYGNIDFNIEATQLLGFNVGYGNAYYNYADDNGSLIPVLQAVSPSQAGLLNRVDHRFHIDSQWKLRPETIGILGYLYGQTVYTADEGILILNTGQVVLSNNKNNRSHTFYAGVQHAFTPTLSGTLKGGAQYYDYYGDVTGQSPNEWSPYVMANLRYLIQTTTTANVGFSYSKSASDLAGQNGASSYVLDTEVALLYGSLTHEIVSHLVGTASATAQYATYNGGGASFDGQHYLFFQLGFDLAYQFTPNFSAHGGYNFDVNDSDIPGQSYNRNRVYLGLTAAY